MKSLRVLITAGPTQEPIDPVRYIGNRSSGQMGVALVDAALGAGHSVTLIAGPMSVSFPDVPRIDVQTAAQMHAAVLAEFSKCDLLIMAAAVADFRPTSVSPNKLGRVGSLVIECEPTQDIVAATARSKRADQRIIGFSLEAEGGIDRAREKLVRKGLDLIVYNPLQTMDSPFVGATLIFADGRTELMPPQKKTDFAPLLLSRAKDLCGS